MAPPGGMPPNFSVPPPGFGGPDSSQNPPAPGTTDPQELWVETKSPEGKVRFIPPHNSKKVASECCITCIDSLIITMPEPVKQYGRGQRMSR
jgi:hypothetical protein